MIQVLKSTTVIFFLKKNRDTVPCINGKYLYIH